MQKLRKIPRFYVCCFVNRAPGTALYSNENNAALVFYCHVYTNTIGRILTILGGRYNIL